MTIVTIRAFLSDTGMSEKDLIKEMGIESKSGRITKKMINESFVDSFYDFLKSKSNVK